MARAAIDAGQLEPLSGHALLHVAQGDSFSALSPMQMAQIKGAHARVRLCLCMCLRLSEHVCECMGWPGQLCQALLKGVLSPLLDTCEHAVTLAPGFSSARVHLSNESRLPGALEHFRCT